jgi:predicted lipoprotein with Yx(FWY)xxD motif
MRIAAVLLGAVLLFGACAEDDPAVAPETTSEATDEADASEEATVQTAESDLGTILVDAEGRTLYVFANDEPGVSNCEDNCATTWPPLAADGDPTAGGEAEESELDTIERGDETEQVTYNDQPLYHFSGDEAAGDTNGQGVGGNWWVVGPDGEPIEEAPNS